MESLTNKEIKILTLLLQKEQVDTLNELSRLSDRYLQIALNLYQQGIKEPENNYFGKIIQVERDKFIARLKELDMLFEKVKSFSTLNDK